MRIDEVDGWIAEHAEDEKIDQYFYFGNLRSVILGYRYSECLQIKIEESEILKIQNLWKIKNFPRNPGFKKIEHKILN